MILANHSPATLWVKDLCCCFSGGTKHGVVDCWISCRQMHLGLSRHRRDLIRIIRAKVIFRSLRSKPKRTNISWPQTLQHIHTWHASRASHLKETTSWSMKMWPFPQLNRDPPLTSTYNIRGWETILFQTIAILRVFLTKGSKGCAHLTGSSRCSTLDASAKWTKNAPRHVSQFNPRLWQGPNGCFRASAISWFSRNSAQQNTANGA